MSAGAGGPAEVAVRIEHARKDYGKAAGGRAEAVADVSITVDKGSIHGLLGPNGAGKTTTLKMLLGLVTPTSGVFELLGAPAHQPGARARIGFLPEQPYFPAQLNAGEAMMLYGRLAGLDRGDARAKTGALLDRVGLDGRQKTPLSKFSRGMLQRLGLAVALLGEPELLVLDEPASGLDPVGQRDIRNLMLDLKAEGATILLSSHQLSEVEVVSDEVSILNRGRVAAEGKIEQLLNVAGQVSVAAKGEGALPPAIATLASDIALTGSLTVFSAPEKDVRAVVDGLDDAGWQLVSLAPKRSSLEDYFATLLNDAEQDAKPATDAAPDTLAVDAGGAL